VLACSTGAIAQAPPSAPPAVTVAKPIVKEVVERDDYVGRFEAIDAVEIRARVSGYLQTVSFRDGAIVKLGDPLFTIDKRPYQAALDQAELNLQYTTIKAPAKGVVSRKSAQVGQVVQPGQPLMALIPLDDVWITANFKETQLSTMRVGQRVTVDVDAYGGREYSGKVDSIAAATGSRFSLLPPENATGNFVKVVQRVPVKIVLDEGQDKERLLRPGMSVTPTVYTR